VILASQRKVGVYRRARFRKIGAYTNRQMPTMNISSAARMPGHGPGDGAAAMREAEVVIQENKISHRWRERAW
jgi:hypothetical protein